MTDDVRWHQRLQNFQRALKRLQYAVDLRAQRELNELEKQGLIQAFEFTHELAWNVMRDYLRSLGQENLQASRDSTRAAFAAQLVHDGEAWMDMIISRNLTSHTYNDETADLIVQRASQSYVHLLTAFAQKMQSIKDAENP